eukprot:10631022-Prorocentrum_lima.AAC.1
MSKGKEQLAFGRVSPSNCHMPREPEVRLGINLEHVQAHAVLMNMMCKFECSHTRALGVEDVLRA